MEGEGDRNATPTDSVFYKLLVATYQRWLAGWVAGWLAGWLAGWVAGWLAGCLAAWPVGWLAGWLAQGPGYDFLGQNAVLQQEIKVIDYFDPFAQTPICGKVLCKCHSGPSR